jgi:hypothetical protein
MLEQTRIFTNEDAYEAYVASSGFTERANVSIIQSNDNVHFDYTPIASE